MKLVPLIRSSYDIGLIGRKGVGKTFLLTIVGYWKQRRGYQIFTNYPVNYPHTMINNIQDFEKILKIDKKKPKVFLGDDFERWFHSRSTKTNLNIELNEILLDFGKVSCSTYFSQKRSMAIDIGLRDSSSEWWIPSLELMYVTNDKNLNNKLKKYLNFLCIHVDRCDDTLKTIDSFKIGNLPYLSTLYDTQAIIEPVKKTTLM